MAICFGGFAQTTISNDMAGYVEVSLKRCFQEGSIVYVDLMFTNHASKDCLVTLWRPTAVDDEGNNYDKYSTYWDVAPANYGLDCNIQAGITKKYRFAIKNMDEYASSLQIVDMVCTWNGCGRFSNAMWQNANIRIRRIPIEK